MRKAGDKAPTKLGDLFEVYRKRLRAPQGSVISATIEVVHDVLGIQLLPTHCDYNTRTRTLRILAKGPIKSEIFMHKDEILAHLKGRLGEKSAPTTLL